MDARERDRSSEGLLDELRAELGTQAVLTGNDIPLRNRNDWSSKPPGEPLAVLRPGNAQEAARAVAACRAARLPFVPQGGLTGLCGGATPEPGWIAISLERMVGIEEIDPVSATMTVKAGTPLEVVQRAADEAGFLFPLDLGSRGSCAIGGNLSTNAGGNRVIRYGMTRDLVLGLEVVLPDGTVLTNLNKLLRTMPATISSTSSSGRKARLASSPGWCCGCSPGHAPPRRRSARFRVMRMLRHSWPAPAAGSDPSSPRSR